MIAIRIAKSESNNFKLFYEKFCSSPGGVILVIYVCLVNFKMG